MSMRAVIVDSARKATAAALSIGQVSRPTLRHPNHVLVNVKAFGLNRMDIMQRRGMYPLPPGVSEILGVEFSGVVEEAGQGESAWKKGDEVFGLAYGGAYAEYIAVDAGMLTAKPSSISWAEAAAIPEAWLTAFQALFLIADMKKGSRVLIHAGAGGVGVAAIQLAKAYGAKEVFTTAGSQAKCDFVKKLGADHAINYRGEDFSEVIKAKTNGQGVDVIIDFIGGDYFEKNVASAARDAHMVLLGLLGGAKTKGPADLSQILFKRMRIEGTTLRSRTVEYQSDLLKNFSRDALPKVIEGHYSLVIHKILPWEDIVEATEIMEGSQNTGKIVCTIGEQ